MHIIILNLHIALLTIFKKNSIELDVGGSLINFYIDFQIHVKVIIYIYMN